MSANDRQAKRRARRIAADEAHAWARNLRLGNPNAKLVLSMLTLYVDGEGCCFVSIPTLSDDTELATGTVRNRLAWLEQIGAIKRAHQWVDENGRRNGEAKGRRTSDLIRLMIDVEAEVIEATASGVSREADPPHGAGSNPEPETADPAATLQRPSDSAQGLISEPEPEFSPKSPPGTSESATPVEDSEPEHFGPAWLAWRGHEVMRRDLALAYFRKLDPDKQVLCRAAIPMFFKLQDQLGRKHTPNFHRWIHAKGFEEFPGATLANPTAPPPRHWLGAIEVRALGVALRMAERALPRLVDDPERGRGLWRLVACEADLRALEAFAEQDPRTWQTVELGTQQFAAWRDRLQHWLGGTVEGERVWLEEFNAAVHGLSATDPNFKLRRSVKALRVPAPWPPLRDGSWPNDDSSEVA